MTSVIAPPPNEAPSSYGVSADGPALDPRLRGLALALLAEIAIIALLLTLGWNVAGGQEEQSLVTLEVRNITAEDPGAEESPPPAEQSEPTPEVSVPDPQPQDVPPEPQEPRPVEPIEVEPPTISLPVPQAPPRPTRPPRQPAPPAKPARTYGPPDTGAPSSQFDSRRVGTAPNGEPLYAARWYREPTRQELAGYLSTAVAPSSALIVCRTVPDFYVEDCELLGESPNGSQIGRAVMAAAWQFRVRPAIVGGRSQVGSWVRIRIDYRREVRR